MTTPMDNTPDKELWDWWLDGCHSPAFNMAAASPFVSTLSGERLPPAGCIPVRAAVTAS